MVVKPGADVVGMCSVLEDRKELSWFVEVCYDYFGGWVGFLQLVAGRSAAADEAEGCVGEGLEAGNEVGALVAGGAGYDY